eukprot:m.365248 g.365248  ORF g.365248 m.365248 type:complete len:78 (-) comp20814_c1_seq2:156-389(-)
MHASVARMFRHVMHHLWLSESLPSSQLFGTFARVLISLTYREEMSLQSASDSSLNVRSGFIDLVCEHLLLHSKAAPP